MSRSDEHLLTRILELERRLQELAAADAVPIVAIGTSSNAPLIINNAATVVNFNATPKDSRGVVTTVPNWRFTAPVGGDYFVSASILMGIFVVNWAAGESAILMCYVNGFPVVYLAGAYDLASGGSAHLSGGRVITLAKNDYVEIWAFQNSGINQVLHNDNKYNWVSIHKIRGVT